MCLEQPLGVFHLLEGKCCLNDEKRTWNRFIFCYSHKPSRSQNTYLSAWHWSFYLASLINVCKYKFVNEKRLLHQNKATLLVLLYFRDFCVPLSINLSSSMQRHSFIPAALYYLILQPRCETTKSLGVEFVWAQLQNQGSFLSWLLFYCFTWMNNQLNQSLVLKFENKIVTRSVVALYFKRLQHNREHFSLLMLSPVLICFLFNTRMSGNGGFIFICSGTQSEHYK